MNYIYNNTSYNYRCKWVKMDIKIEKYFAYM